MNRDSQSVIGNRQDIAGSPARDLALDCIAAGIRATHPEVSIRNALSVSDSIVAVAGDEYDRSAYDRLVVLGGGNAAGTAASALEGVLGDAIDDGAVVTDNPVETEDIRMGAGDHPLPSQQGVDSTLDLLALADDVGANDLVITLITGGGSALLAAPDGLEVDDQRDVTESLLESGATIHEINAVRKHLSEIKGGRLARRLAPATVIGLLWSDVVGDDPSVIASGPLSPDPSTYADAEAVLDGYDIDVPTAVRERLRAGEAGELEETPASNAPAFDRVHTYIVASNGTATTAAGKTADQRGFTPHILGSRIRGRAREVAKVLVGIAEAVRATGQPVEAPAVLISGGETTVRISGDGTGGPNHELATSAALELDAEDITVAAVDTDGIDGNASAAGGIVTAETASDRAAAHEALANNDTGPHLADVGAAIRTGPTETNVNDLHVIVVADPEASP
ncbi:MAG: DUF4147 domain-containing protein [Haloarculaceae archaeon]